MACNCKRMADYPVDSTTGLLIAPHEIHPGESCIYCAEKHMDTAYTYATGSGIFGVIRQHIIGELELARRHTFNEYSSIADDIKKALVAVMLRQPGVVELISNVVLDIQKHIEETETAKLEATGKHLYRMADVLTLKQTPILGELHICAAWELATEVGYFNVNRAMIIGDLVLAQKHFAGYNTELLTCLTDIRHAVQRSEQDTLAVNWVDAASKCESLITGNIKALTADLPDLGATIVNE